MEINFLKRIENTVVLSYVWFNELQLKDILPSMNILWRIYLGEIIDIFMRLKVTKNAICWDVCSEFLFHINIVSRYVQHN